MEKSLKFNSQVCTTKEQSQRLLELGLKLETADCMHSYLVKDFRGRETAESGRHYYLTLFNQDEFQAVGLSQYEKIPAWSLHRLIELYKDVGDTSTWSLENVNYNRLIQCVSLAIKHGAFNKEYLKQ